MINNNIPIKNKIINTSINNIKYDDLIELNSNIKLENNNDINDQLKHYSNYYKIKFDEKEYEYILSFLFYKTNNKTLLKKIKNNLYFIKNTTKNNKIYIISEFEYLELINYINNNNNNNLDNKYSNIIIYNCFFN